MFYIITDANIINGYFQETVSESDSQLTADPSPIFDRLGDDHTLFLVMTDFVVPKYNNGSEDETDFPGPANPGSMAT